MRTARIKVDQADTWYHCYNQTVGSPHDRPFGNAEKEVFVRLLHKVSLLYGVRVAAYQVMSNHFHLLLHAPVGMPSDEEMCRRYRVFYRGKKIMNPGTPLCEKWRRRSRDISWFMRHLQQLFTMWYNDHGAEPRRGPLWASRFKNTILEHTAVWRCWKYIENNPVRAGMVKHAGDYRFCTYGMWRQSGRHPFYNNAAKLILPLLGMADLNAVMEILGNELGEDCPEREERGFSQTVKRRVRYWTDGLVIGTELFIREVMATHHPAPDKHRMASPTFDAVPITAWRRLRAA